MNIQAGRNPGKRFFEIPVNNIFKGEGPSRTKFPGAVNKYIKIWINIYKNIDKTHVNWTYKYETILVDLNSKINKSIYWLF